MTLATAAEKRMMMVVGEEDWLLIEQDKVLSAEDDAFDC
jgi:hypothetical protein